MRKVVLVLVLVAGCLRSNTLTCPDGSTCPDDATCVIAAGRTWCATADQLASCLEQGDGTACSFSDAAGTCFGEVCLPAECGNLRVDVGEQCDDANAEHGDGCSADCRSDETCGNGVVDVMRSEECDDQGRVDHDGCSSTCVRETPLWTDIQSAPGPRFGASLAYDAAYDRVLLFGGSSSGPSGGTDLDDLWAWNGDGWTRVSTPIAPAARTFHAMAYDAAAQQTLLFGGVRLDQRTTERDPEPYGDTWSWNGATWSLVDPPQSPVARSQHAMAYDAARKRVVLYGGSLPWSLMSQPPGLDDTWEWTGTTWVQLCTACGPGPREGHAMAYDPVRGVIVLFGGRPSKSDKPLAALWELRNGVWTEVIVADGPPGRTGARLAFDPVAKVVVLSSGIGSSGTPLEDTWTWDGVSWLALSGAVPSSATYDGATATDPRRGEVITFGGHVANTDPIAVTDRWTQATWQGFTPVAPSPRYDHAAAYDVERGYGLIWGGQQITDPVTWLHDGEHWIQGDAAPMPPRADHAMAYDPLRREVVLAGGTSTGDATHTWVMRDGAWTDTQVVAPSRVGHSLAFDGTRVIMFGGEYNGFFTDTWAWTGSAWTQLAPPSHPPERVRFAMAYDPIRARVVLFGGYAGIDGWRNDTWEWDGTTWNELVTTVKPQARDGATLVWDPWRRRLVLFGGSSTASVSLDDAWELDGSTWTQLVLPVRPPARFGHVMFMTPRGVVVHGGPAEDPRVWRLRWESYAREESCTAGTDLDGDGRAACADEDCWTMCSPLCPPGTSCPVDAPGCGDGTCAIVEDCRTCPDDCGTCNICGDAMCDSSETLASCPGDCTP